MPLCADDAAINRRQEPYESHHLAGRPHPIVMDVSVNWHRVMSAMQRARPKASPFEASLLTVLADLLLAIVGFLRREPHGSPSLLNILSTHADCMYADAKSFESPAKK